MEFVNTFWALVPPIVAIVLALITKETYSSLFIGIVVGAVLLAASVLMATARVLGGVHFPRDVIAGAAFALVMGAIGYIAIPLPL